MPTRRLPRTDAERDAAIRNGKNRKDAVPPPPVIPYTAATITRINTFQPIYHGKILAVAIAKNAQTDTTPAVTQAKTTATYYELDFIDALNKAIRRGEMNASVRAFYQLNVSDNTLPKIVTESDVTTWGQNINDGETARIAAGGAPITFPSLAQVNTAVTNFNTLNQGQGNAKAAYDAAQEDLSTQNEAADKLILKMWNETETAFDEGDKASMRRKAREFGVVYVPIAGETPSPDDFSISGKVTDSATGLAVPDAVLLVEETNTIVTTDTKGEFLVAVQPPATYTLKIIKNGYINGTVNGVVVTAGVITNLNIQLTPGINTGTVKGKVLQGIVAVQATITVEGTALSTTTDPMGTYELTNVPEGNHNIKATLNSNPTIFQTLPTNVPADDFVTVDFNLP